MKLNLSYVYGIRDMLYGIKKEMDKNGLTFDEFLVRFDDGIKELERANEKEA
jgi:hypothetical protein